MERNKHVFIGEIRAIGTTITGTIPYNSLSLDLGNFKERILPGAFTESIKSRNILALLAHDKRKPLANSAKNTLKFIDGRDGLTVTMSLDPHISWHADALQATRRGDFTGMSFGFGNATDRWREENGERIRELISVDLREISPVVWAAYPGSTIATRSKYSTSKGSRNMSKLEMMTERKRVLDRMREIESTIDVNTEHRSEWETLDIEYERLSSEIAKTDRAEKMQEREWELSQSSRVPTRPTPTENRQHSERTDDRSRANANEQRDLQLFTRALSMDGGSGDKAGFLVSPTMMGKIITKVKDDTPIIAACDTMMVEKAASIMLPTLETDPANPAWTAELRIGTEDTTADFQGRALSPHPLAQYIKISKKLIEASEEAVVPLVEDRMGYKFNLVMENGILNGNGSNQMLGVFQNSTHGISTDRDVSANNTANQIKADNLIEIVYTLKAGYLRNAQWAFSRAAMRQIRQLKTGDGQYLLQIGLTENAPDKILGRPIMISEFVPDTFTSGQYVGILGDWKYYKIAIAKNTSFEILRELFALTNQIAIVARAEIDGMVAISEAFVRCKLG